MKYAYGTALALIVISCGAPTPRDELVSGNDRGGAAGNSSAGGSGGSVTGGAPNEGGTGGRAGGAGGAGGLTVSGGTGGSQAAGGSAGMTMTGGTDGAAGMGGMDMTGGMGGAMANGGAAGATMAGGMGGAAGATMTAGMGGTDPARFNFETTTQGWVDTHVKGGITLSLATTPVFAGSRSLAVQINSSGAGTPGSKLIGLRESPPSGTAGVPVKYRVWVPSAAPIQGVQPYIMVWDAVRRVTSWHSTYKHYADVQRDTWFEIQVPFPDTTNKMVYEIGVEFTFRSAWQGTVFIDAVDW